MFTPQQEAILLNNIGGAWMLVNGTELPKVAVPMLMRAIASYDYQLILKAVERVVMAGKGRLTLADIVSELQSNDGRPSAEEAFGICCQTLNEAITVVWTTEMAEAWGVASGLMEMGDKYNASRAFKDRYDRIVSESRMSGVKVQWLANIGTDPGSRQQAIEQAVSAGLITSVQAIQLLPSYAPDGQKVLASIEQKAALRIEGKTVPPELSRADELRLANEAMKKRKEEAAKRNPEQPRPDGTKSRRDSMAIFEEAEKLGVISAGAEKREWLAKAAAGEDMRELQALILLHLVKNKAAAK